MQHGNASCDAPALLPLTARRTGIPANNIAPAHSTAMQVPSFDSGVAMELINQELGRPWQEVYSELRWA